MTQPLLSGPRWRGVVKHIGSFYMALNLAGVRVRFSGRGVMEGFLEGRKSDR